MFPMRRFAAEPTTVGRGFRRLATHGQGLSPGLLAVVLLLPVVGCAAPARLDPSNEPSRTASSVVAYVGGRPVSRRLLEESLMEAKGREVLEELFLAALLEERLLDAGRVVRPPEVEAERKRLLDALGGSEDEGERLLRDLRERRGLGPERFDRLLRRNASLRMLVAPSIEVSDGAVRRAFDLSHGRRYLLRLLAADTPGEAIRLRRRVLEGEPFADVASEESIDASRDRGGLLDPVHPADPTFPPAIRAAAETLAPGELSEVLALQSGFGYAVVQLQAVLAADGVTFSDAEPTIRGRLRADLERLRMEQLARTLRAQAEVVILDPRLQTSVNALRP